MKFNPKIKDCEARIKELERDDNPERTLMKEAYIKTLYDYIRCLQANEAIQSEILRILPPP